MILVGRAGETRACKGRKASKAARNRCPEREAFWCIQWDCNTVKRGLIWRYAAVLRASSGNMAEAARQLGVARSTLYRALKR